MHRIVRARVVHKSRLAAHATLAGVLLAVAVLASWWPSPARWFQADAFAELAERAAWPWVAALPLGQRAVRPDLAATVVVVAVALAVSWAALQLFRGPGRLWAAAAAGPVAAFALLHQVDGDRAPEPLRPLLFTLLATLSVAEFVRPLVRFGRLSPRSSTVALALASTGALVDARAGLPFLLVVLVGGIVRADRALSLRTRLRVSAVGTSPLLGLLAVGTGAVPDGLHLALPDLTAFQGHLPQVLLYPAVAMIGLLMLPLRWRGGIEIAVFTTAAAVVADEHGPLSPTTTLLAALSLCVGGWVWLAGIAPGLPTPARHGLAALAVVAVLWTQSSFLGRPAAAARDPERGRLETPSLVRLHVRGLLAPGDVLLSCDPWMRRSLRTLQGYEGLRPDLRIEDPDDYDEPGLQLAAAEWAQEGRRVLSESFTLGGRWTAAWAVDAGPLFWFVSDAQHEDREFTDLSAFEPDVDAGLDPEAAARWTRFRVERVRFRRALDRPTEALALLPVDEGVQRTLIARLRVLESMPQALGVSEIPEGLGADADFGPGRLFAEAGDLVWAHGERELGASLLLQAIEAGFRPAWGVLVRWQLRAGDPASAWDTLSAMLDREDLHDQVAEVLTWMADRGRLSDALELRARLGRAPGGTALQLAARLQVLRGLATRPIALPGDDAPLTR